MNWILFPLLPMLRRNVSTDQNFPHRVRAFLHLNRKNLTPTRLGRLAGLNHETIARILDGKTWTWITQEKLQTVMDHNTMLQDNHLLKNSPCELHPDPQKILVMEQEKILREWQEEQQRLNRELDQAHAEYQEKMQKAWKDQEPSQPTPEPPQVFSSTGVIVLFLLMLGLCFLGITLRGDRINCVANHCYKIPERNRGGVVVLCLYDLPCND